MERRTRFGVSRLLLAGVTACLFGCVAQASTHSRSLPPSALPDTDAALAAPTTHAFTLSTALPSLHPPANRRLWRRDGWPANDEHGLVLDHGLEAGDLSVMDVLLRGLRVNDTLMREVGQRIANNEVVRFIDREKGTIVLAGFLGVLSAWVKLPIEASKSKRVLKLIFTKVKSEMTTKTLKSTTKLAVNDPGTLAVVDTYTTRKLLTMLAPIVVGGAATGLAIGATTTTLGTLLGSHLTTVAAATVGALVFSGVHDMLEELLKDKNPLLKQPSLTMRQRVNKLAGVAVSGALAGLVSSTVKWRLADSNSLGSTTKASIAESLKSVAETTAMLATGASKPTGNNTKNATTKARPSKPPTNALHLDS